MRASLFRVRSLEGLASGPARQWQQAAVLAAVLVAGFATFGIQLNDDIAWQLWIGRQVLHGARLYTEVMEINPPLWFWMSVPVVALADVMGSQPELILRFTFLTAIVLSLHLLGKAVSAAPMKRTLLQVSMLVSFTLLVLPDFGEREHYVLIAAVPYVALAATRAEGIRIARSTAFGIGLLAASAFLLKPHFAVAPLALELWLLARMRRNWRIRPESWALALAAITYGVLIATFAPDYVRSMVPMIVIAYQSYRLPYNVLLLSPECILAVLAVCCAVNYRGPLTSLGQATFLAFLAFLIAYLAQQKGWRYHTLPSLGLLPMLAVAEMGDLITKRRVLTAWVLGGMAAVAVASGPLLMSSLDRPNRFRTDAEAALADLGRGDVVMAFAAHSSTIWPMVEERGLVWPSRYMTFWMIPAIARAEHGGQPTPAIKDLAAQIRAETLQDLLCRTPHRILVHDPRGGWSMEGIPFDFMEFFRVDPELAGLLDRYRRVGTFGFLTAYDLADPKTPPTPANCRQVH